MASQRRRIQSLETASTLLSTLKERGEATLAELDAEVDLTKGTVHTYLTTLDDLGWIVREGSTYRLGPQFMTYGAHVKNRYLVFQAGKRQARELAHTTGEICEIATEHAGKCVMLHRFYGENAIDTDYQLRSFEQTKYLHHGSVGKSMLAHMPPERVDEILERKGLPALTEKTITDRETLLDELERIRERGYSFNDEEELRGIRAVGAPVLNSEGDVLGAFSVAGPRGRIDDERFVDTLPDLVTEARSLIEVNVGANEFRTFSPQEQTDGV